MSRRASLPGADELFRRTGAEGRSKPAEASPSAQPAQKEDKSTKLQVADPPELDRKAPKHDEKVTFYCTRDDLMGLERARLRLRAEQGIGADRGRIIRTALNYLLEDFDARGDDSILLRELRRGR